jgi:hypothetical protein
VGIDPDQKTAATKLAVRILPVSCLIIEIIVSSSDFLLLYPFL